MKDGQVSPTIVCTPLRKPTCCCCGPGSTGPGWSTHCGFSVGRQSCGGHVLLKSVGAGQRNVSHDCVASVGGGHCHSGQVMPCSVGKQRIRGQVKPESVGPHCWIGQVLPKSVGWHTWIGQVLPVSVGGQTGQVAPNSVG